MRIVRVEPKYVGKNKPPCTFVLVTATDRPGTPCGMRSDFRVDGAPRCRNHAGQMALTHLLKLSDLPADRMPCPHGGECFTPSRCKTRGHCGNRTLEP